MILLDLSPEFPANEVGGKAANLARLMALNLPVPESRVLPSKALRYFLEHTGLIEQVTTLLDAYEGLDWSARLAAFERLSSIVCIAPLPDDLRSTVDPVIIKWLDRTPNGLAVRSSAVCEDMEGASFAGIYESQLGITNVDRFWQAVKHCWCSAWSPQAVAYARRMGMTLPVDGMALLIQPLIEARSAGVIFTADPVTGNPWRFVVNAVPGLANRLMDGEVSADRFVLAWDSGEILERHVATKPKASVFVGDRVVQIPLEPTLQAAAALSDTAMSEIGRLALSVDRAFDRRMDVEWAMDGEQIILLQARPLTALPAFFPHTLTPEQASETWTPYLNTYGNLNASERLIAPFSRDRWMVKLWHRFLTPDDIFPRIRFQEMDVNGYRYATQRSWGGNDHDRGYAEGWLAENEPRLRRDWLAQLQRVQDANRVADEAAQTAVTAADWVRLTLALRREEYEMQSAVWYAAQWMGLACDDLLQNFFNEVMPDASIPGLPGCVLQGLSCSSVERSAAAQALGRSVTETAVIDAFAKRPLLEAIPYLQAEHPECRFLRDFINFCHHYGMKPLSPDGVKNVSGQDLEGLLLVIKTSMLSQANRTRVVKDMLASSIRQRKESEETVRAYLRVHRPDQLDRFDRLLEWAQFWVPALDDRKWHCTMTNRLDGLFPRCGEALTEEGLIDQPEAFKLLTPEEWQAYVDNPDPAALRAVYNASRHAYERNRRLEPLPYLGKPPQAKEMSEVAPEAPVAASLAPPTAATSSTTIFKGEGIAPGVARGIACKVSNLEDPSYVNRLTSETILICATDLVNAQWRRDWYSLFMVVRGLVTVQGASLHHATQIARECGVPFINLPSIDFDTLPDEVEIEIDGQTGHLRVMNPDR